MNNKSIYRDLCSRETAIPIFLCDWWMDAVCGDENWDVILLEKGGQVVAVMPYYFIKKINGIKISQPLLTQKNGIWIKYPLNQKLASRISFQRNIIKEVIEKLESLKLISYNQNFDYNFTNWMPFYWNNFSQYTRYTYIIEDLYNLEHVYSELHSNIRKNIRKAQKMVSVKEELSIEEFYKINKMTFERQNMKVPYTLEFLKKIDETCIKKRCRKIFYAEDKEGRIHAAIYIVWDENSAYWLMGGANPELRSSEATTLLTWEAIKFSSTVTKIFDFEGSMIEPIEKFFSSFGAIQKPYFNIGKEYKRGGLIYIIAKNIYDYYPWLQKTYKRIRGR